MQEAAKTAGAADVAVVVLSSPPTDDAEDRDRPSMRLEEGCYELVRRVTAAGKPVVLVLQSGAPVEIPARENVSAILETFLSGSGGGEATARLLTGEVAPSGKLAETYPERFADCPAAAFYDGHPDRMGYGEGLMTDYRYYATKRVRPAYPFGFGLSYTTFRYSDPRAERTDKGVRLSVDVTNTGGRDGREIVQFYAVKRPEISRELVGFVKVDVPAGQTVRAETTADLDAFAVYKGGWTLEREAYEIIAAASSADDGVRIVVQLRRKETE